MTKGHFAAALNAPFSTVALGAQIPDVFSHPTDTRHFRATFNVRPDANGGGEFVILPSPLMSVACPSQGLASGVGGVTGTLITTGYKVTEPGNNVSITAAVVAQANPQNVVNVYGCTDMPTMNSIFSQFRVVGWGYKIRALTNLSNTQGRVACASIPAPRFIPDIGLFSPNVQGTNSAGGTPTAVLYPQYDFYAALIGASGATAALQRGLYRYPAADNSNFTGFASTILDHPVSAEVTSVQLTNQPLKGHGKINTREFENWRTTESVVGPEVVDANIGGVQVLLAEGYQSTPNLTTTLPSNLGFGQLSINNGVYHANDMKGWNAVLIAMSGFQTTGTGAANGTALEVEIIYHVEGIQPIKLGSNGVIAIPQGGRVCRNDPVLAMSAEAINGAAGKLCCCY